MEKFDMKKFAQEVHANAVEHGWWEGERPIKETLALIHSEWSEALNEYRNERPLYYHACKAYGEGVVKSCNESRCPFEENRQGMECPYRDKKPEGIAVELIDGVIRILDLMEQYEIRMLEFTPKIPPESLPELVFGLHFFTSGIIELDDGILEKNCEITFTILIAMVFRWVRSQGIDPYELMHEKHEYNKTRPYKHGKVC